jgi:glycerol-3-phosphate acyltransferase PlsX
MKANPPDSSPPTVIAVDAMGGDYAPGEVVRGAALVSLTTTIHTLLVGDPDQIKHHLQENEHNPAQIVIIPTDQWITNEDHPREAIMHKPRASMLIAAELCGQKQAHGLVSAGNTGAYVLSVARHIPRLPGIHKTAIAAVYPTQNVQRRHDPFALLLDVGANVHCSVDDLVKFALMGKIYASDVKGVANPTIALLNMGKESHKGGDILTRTYAELERLEGLNFVGNIEGNEIMKGLADVVITEGYVGNIVMKTIEGIAETLQHLGRYAFKHRFIWMLGLIALSGGIRQLKQVTDYSEYGGAPLLGFQEIVIKAHGRSKAKAISNAIKVAAKTHRDGVCAKIAAEVAKFMTDNPEKNSLT